MSNRKSDGVCGGWGRSETPEMTHKGLAGKVYALELMARAHCESIYDGNLLIHRQLIISSPFNCLVKPNNADRHRCESAVIAALTWSSLTIQRRESRVCWRWYRARLSDFRFSCFYAQKASLEFLITKCDEEEEEVDAINSTFLFGKICFGFPLAIHAHEAGKFMPRKIPKLPETTHELSQRLPRLTYI